MVNEDEAIAVNKELNEGSVLVMVAEVIMKLTLVMEMVVDKDVNVKVDEEVNVEVDWEVFEEKNEMSKFLATN